jgi:hypothetical protein
MHLDVLAVGDDGPPARVLTRPRVTAAGAVLVLLAGLAAAGDLRDEQRAAAEQQRLASVVDLRLDPESSATGAYDHQSHTATLELLLPVHNDGPHDVVILSGGAGGYGLARPIELRAGSRGVLRLEQTLDCSTARESPEPVDTLELSVRTAAGLEPRRVRVPMPDSWTEHGPHMCRPVPLHQAVTLDVIDISALPEGLRVTIEAVNSSAREVTVAAVRIGDPGVEATLEQPAAGPVRLLRRNGVGTVRVLIHVTDCATARTAFAARPLALEVLVEDDRSHHALPPVVLGPAVHEALVGRSC